MKIFITSLSLGGAERIVKEQLEKNKDSNITLIVLYNKSNEYKIPSNVNIIRLNGKIEFGRTLFQEIANNGEHLVCHLASNNTLKYLYKLNVKVSIVFHNDKRGWKNTSNVFNHKNVINLITVSKHIRKQLEPLTKKPIIDIRHTVYINHENKVYKTRKELGLPTDKNIIGMVGRIAPQKDYLYALELISEMDKDYILVIVGGYEESNKDYMKLLIFKTVQLGIQDRVIFTGFKSNAYDYMANFDIGLNTSHYEGLSIATQEMLSFERRVFLRSNDGQKEILDLNSNITYFQKGDDFEINSIHTMNDVSEEMKKVSYISKNQWNLLNYIDYSPKKETLFLTQNLGLGGAQRSLVNLIKMTGHDLVVLNESNYDEFIIELFRNKNNVEYIDKKNVFDICKGLFPLLSEYEKVVFWNLDPKVKLLIAKFFPNLKIYDVSPGNYCLDELKAETTFINGISYNEVDYFNQIERFVSKYDFSHEDFLYKEEIMKKSDVIVNGVIAPEKRKEDYTFKGKGLLLGRIANSKYVSEIVKSFNNLDITLDVIGSVGRHEEDYFKNNVEPFLSSNINLLPATNKAQEVMTNYDFIIVLGINQGSPNTVLEAISVGLPVISNDSGGTKDMLAESGILLDEIDEEKITSAVKLMRDDYTNFTKRSKKRRISLLEEYSMKKFQENYENLLK